MDGHEANKGKVFTPKATAQTNRYAARAGLELGGWLFLGSTLQVRAEPSTLVGGQ